MSAARPIPAPVDPSTMDHFVYLRVNWQGYQQLLALRGESSVPRITYMNGLADRGAEADECYTVRRVVKSDDERPDIAIEVVWTSGGINKLEVYRKLGVREVWFYERGKLRFFALRRESDDDVYREIPRSEFLPQLPIDVLLTCMKEPDQSSAVRALRAALAKG